MHLGVAQLVARYLGVVEAASSSLVTQTMITGQRIKSLFRYYFWHKSLFFEVFMHFLFQNQPPEAVNIKTHILIESPFSAPFL